MPKTLLDVQDEFTNWQKNYGSDPRVATATLADYAKMADESAATPGERASAYDPHWYQTANAAVDRVFRATHVPQLVGEGASGFARLVGASPKVQEVAKRIGEDLPRSLVESIATIPAGPVGEAAVWGPRIARLRQILGYGGSALSGYAATDSPAGAAISAGSLALGNKFLLPESLGGKDVGGRVAATLRDRLGVGQTVEGATGANLAAETPVMQYAAPGLARTAAGAGGVAAEVGTLSALNEATRQAQLSVGPHALSINDEQRNPFTEENVAGNVLNAVPFLPQLLKGARGAAWDPRAVRGMKEWIDNRRTAIEQTRVDPTAEAVQDAIGEVKPTSRIPDEEFSFARAMEATPPRWSPQERETLVKSAKSFIDAGAGWAAEGDATKAQAAYDSATRVLTESGLTKDDLSQMKDGATSFDSEARQLPPQDGPGLADFIQRFNSFVDYLNENRGKFEERLAGELSKAEETQLRAAAKPGETQSWRPEARAPEVVSRLQEKGLLPKIDETWLRNEFKYEVEDKGNTEFAKNVVVQKAVNRVLDQLPGALEKEKTLPATEAPRAPTEDEARVQAAQKTLANRQADFHDAIAEIGKSSEVAANEILKMSVEYFQRPILPDLVMKGKVVKGVPSSFVSNWIDIVTEAARTYDPVSQTIQTRQGRQPISVLWRDEPSVGIKQLRPQLRALSAAEGGRVRGKTLLPETSIEGMARPENVVPEGEQSLTEGAMQAGLSGDATQGAVFRREGLRGEEGTTPVEDVLPAEEAPKAVRDQFLAPGETLRKRLESMTDEQVWDAVKGQYPQGRSSGMYEFRRQNAKLLFQAAIEDAGKKKGDPIGAKGQELVNRYYYAGFGDVGQGRRALGVILNSMFQSHVKAPPAFLRRMGAFETSERNRNKYGWMMAGVDAILKKGPLASGDTSPADFLGFSGPTRLAQWAARPTGAFTTDAQGMMRGKNVIPLLQRLGVTKDEIEMYRALGLDSILGAEKVLPAEVVKWMEEKAPRVETKALIPEDRENSPERRRYFEAQHALESRGLEVQGSVVRDALGNNVTRRHIEHGKLVGQLEDSYEKYTNTPPSDAATGRYGVEPKDLKDMPGAVDLLVRDGSSEMNDNHFGESGRGLVSWVRGYEETLPNDEKVFHVYELQEAAKIKDGKHPFTPFAEQLALKAAIDHARKIGATKVALSDAETAMMTEGHDRVPGVGRWVVTDRDGSTIHVFDTRAEAEQRISQISDPRDRNIQLAVPPQEKGMRAAYDDRLPKTMEKLTGDRGSPVDFGFHKTVEAEGYDVNSGGHYRTENPGSPVFKNPDGSKKATITGRLYDISRAEPRWSAFSYSRPAEGTPAGPQDLLVNHPQPGAFLGDVYRTLHSKFTEVLGSKGQAGTYRDLMVELGMSIARQTADPKNVDFYRVASGPRGLAWDRSAEDAVDVGERGKVGLKVDTTPRERELMSENQWVASVLYTFAHELAHIDDFIAHGALPKPDAFSEERARVLRNIRSLGETLTPEQRNLVITSVEAGTRPPENRPVGTDPGNRALRYGSTNPEEFTATLMGLVTQSLLFGKGSMKSAMDVFDYSPTEVREFAQNTYRSIRDVASALKETIATPGFRTADKVPEEISRYVTSEAFDALMKSAEFASKVRDADIELAATREMVANMEGKIPVGPTASVWFKRQEEIGKYQPEVSKTKSLENALEAIEDATQTIGLSYGKREKNSAFVDWVFPFSNKMDFWRRKGIVMADPLASLVFNVESNINLVRSAIFAPWLKKLPDGTVDWNSANPFEGLVAKNSRLRDAFNEVRRWQNENPGMMTVNGEQVPTREPIFVVDQQGIVQLNDKHSADMSPVGVSTGKVQEAWAKISRGLSLEEQDALKAGSVAADQQGQLQWARTEGFVRDYAVYRVGQMLQRFNRSATVEQLEPLAVRVVGEVMNGRADALRGVIPDGDLQHVVAYLQGPMGDIQRIRTLAQTRPGHSTESLPGDYVIMYKDREGKVKFTSAPTEYQAGYVMRKVEAQGNTLIGENPVHKSKLRGKFQDFDDPFDVLEKAAYHENEAWKTAVEAVRKTHGDAVADDMMQGYVPLSDSMKDVTSQGFRKFVDKSDNKVDPENLDYLDALFARGSRFAASAVYHVTNAQKEFYLNDPRARMFPSLREAVDQQWQHMTSPTDLRFRQFRGLTAGYFMAGSISNAVMELTQGVTSFVPRIIASNTQGGIMKGYQDLFRAVGQVPTKLTNTEWTHLAAVAERKEAAGGVLSGDETRALMFKWGAERGIFGHNIIGEIFSSRDFAVQQKKLFGEGDYGPKSPTDLLLNPLYVASQTLTGIYSWAAKLNDKIAFTMGVNQGMEQGLRGEALLDHAKRFHQLVQGGGKTDAPGMVAKTAGADPMYRNAVGLMYTLQHYGTKMLATYVQMGAEAIGESKALTAAQKVQARKAFLTFTATQLAMSGALGVPFVGAAMTLLEDEFGVPVKETVRKGLAALGSENPDSVASGSAVTDVAMNGVVNQTLGIDAATRLGVSSLFGTSAYKGFALADLFGPAPSIVENMVKSLNYFGQGEPMQAARAMVPNAFKNAVNVADSRQKYGTFALRDQGDDLLYKPTPAQTLLYQLGFQPRQASNRRQAQQLLGEMNKRSQGETDRQVVDAARGLIGGDPSAAQRYAQELSYADPTVRRDDVLRRILGKATDLQVEKDLLATGPRANEQARGEVMGTFPTGTNPRQSEVGVTALKTQLAAQLGSPSLIPDRQEWTRAAVVDSLIAQSGGTMARSQALALARLMGL